MRKLITLLVVSAVAFLVVSGALAALREPEHEWDGPSGRPQPNG